MLTLVVMCIHTRIDLRSPALQILTLVTSIRVEDACQLDLQLNRAVLVEDPVNTVLVVCGRKDLTNEQFSRPSDGTAIVAEVGMLEENPGIFFVDTDGVLDGFGSTGTIHEIGV